MNQTLLRDLAEEGLQDDDTPLRRPDRPGSRVRWSTEGTEGTEGTVGTVGTDEAGTWWPASRDATTELRALVPVANTHLGCDITRFSLHRGDWSADQPRRITVDGRTVRLGWFDRLPASTVTLGHGTGPRTVLHLVPFPTPYPTSEVIS
jgi:hypothetical protein